MVIGAIISMTENTDADFAQLERLGLKSCQLVSWRFDLFTDEMAEKVKETAEKYGVEITALWCGWSGPAVWNFEEGPLTLGIVPAAYRMQRCKELKQGSDFAKKIGVKDVVTHLGFIPETPSSEQYLEVVSVIRDLGNYMKNNGQRFLFETGQETPVTIKRLIEDAGTGNLGLNLDPANLILYGKANPVDALDVFGEYVYGVHAKDGNYPTDSHNLGMETKIGEGQVDFPRFINKLKKCGYDGALTIEREISGEQQTKDILESIGYLNELIENKEE